jgi:hypothetical protein
MKYDSNYFINKFKHIPEHRWMTGNYGTGEDISAPHCALGHCGARLRPSDDPEAEVLSKLFLDNLSQSVAFVNDNCYGRYDQSTPKARILAALQDIKNKGG